MLQLKFILLSSTAKHFSLGASSIIRFVVSLELHACCTLNQSLHMHALARESPSLFMIQMYLACFFFFFLQYADGTIILCPCNQ